jgi:hypothetical protein
LHHTKLLWVETTPVPTVPMYSPNCTDDNKCMNPPRYDADVTLYNQAAAKVVAVANSAGANISTAPLYDFVLSKCGGKGYNTCPGFQLPNNVHFEPAGWSALATKVYSVLMAL